MQIFCAGNPAAPAQFALYANASNPAEPVVWLHYSLRASSNANRCVCLLESLPCKARGSVDEEVGAAAPTRREAKARSRGAKPFHIVGAREYSTGGIADRCCGSIKTAVAKIQFQPADDRTTLPIEILPEHQTPHPLSQHLQHSSGHCHC